MINNAHTGIGGNLGQVAKYLSPITSQDQWIVARGPQKPAPFIIKKPNGEVVHTDPKVEKCAVLFKNDKIWGYLQAQKFKEYAATIVQCNIDREWLKELRAKKKLEQVIVLAGKKGLPLTDEMKALSEKYGIAGSKGTGESLAILKKAEQATKAAYLKVTQQGVYTESHVSRVAKEAALKAKWVVALNLLKQELSLAAETQSSINEWMGIIKNCDDKNTGQLIAAQREIKEAQLKTKKAKRLFMMGCNFDKDPKAVEQKKAQFVKDKGQLLYLQWKGVSESNAAKKLADHALKQANTLTLLEDQIKKRSAKIVSLEDQCAKNGKDSAACKSLQQAKDQLKAKAKKLAMKRSEIVDKRKQARGLRKDSNKSVDDFVKHRNENESGTKVDDEKLDEVKDALTQNEETSKKIDDAGQKVVDAAEVAREAAKKAGIPIEVMADIFDQMDKNSRQAKKTSPNIVLPDRLNGNGDDAKKAFPWLLLLAGAGAAAGAIPIAAAGAVAALGVMAAKKKD